MGTIVTDDKHYKNIANTIREKTGSEDTYTSADMASGVNEVYEAGKQKEWSDFWDIVQKNGTRTDYDMCFYQKNYSGSIWTDDSFKPKYSMYPTSLNRTFYGANITDFAKVFSDRGLVFDTSNCKICNMTFSQSKISRVGVLNLENATDIVDIFAYNNFIESIELMVLSEKITANWNSPFIGCIRLKEIRFGGVIPKSIKFPSSPLSVDSMKSIITHLKNFAGTADEFLNSLTLTSACKTLLEAEGATSPNGNLWTEYVADLGWTLL
jgi:hypothetical protein